MASPDVTVRSGAVLTEIVATVEAPSQRGQVERHEEGEDEQNFHGGLPRDGNNRGRRLTMAQGWIEPFGEGAQVAGEPETRGAEGPGALGERGARAAGSDGLLEEGLGGGTLQALVDGVLRHIERLPVQH